MKTGRNAEFKIKVAKIPWMYVLTLLSLTQTTLGVYQSNCYQDYPILLGEKGKDVYFQSLDMDPLSNIIVGGSTGDTASS